jgi:hypothetical protein
VPAAGRSSVVAHRRSLVTATAAGAVLCALWFVPSAKATPDAPGWDAREAVASASAHASAHAPHGYGTSAAVADSGAGGPDTPYVLGGLGFAGAGGALIMRSRRRAAASSQRSSPVTD